MEQNIEKELGFEPCIHPLFTNISDEEPLSPEKISEMLGISKETVRRWCRSGKLENYNFGGKYVIIGSDFKYFMKKSKSRKSFTEVLH
ncbi:helix-turn-helix domain-containing protein [Falsibacillus pallidus]|uniref:helix-turn-helix domain-containing protein n=1 Tax=Falsibacillus pallidus TaxID=493781 RepID=UPI003D99C139